MRTWFWLNVVGAFALIGVSAPALTKPEDNRSMHREAATVAAAWEDVDFGCLHGVVCGVTADYQFCAEGATLVDGELTAPTCGGVVGDSFRMTFDPPMTSLIVLSLFGDSPAVHCWTHADDVGDESLGFLLTPVNPVEPGTIYTEGRIRTAAGPDGAVACDVFGATVVRITIWE